MHRSSYVTNEDIEFTANIKDNTFEIDAGGIPAVSFISTAARTLPLIIDGNYLRVYTSNSSSNALLLSNITGGVVKNNNITNYRNGILMLSSSMDIYHNDLSCDSIGVQVISGTANLGAMLENQLGGLNQISCVNNNGANLKAVTGYFSTGIGYNRFNVNSSSAYHFAGSFPGTMGFEDYAGYNCFQLDSLNSDPQENVGCTGPNCDVIYEYYPFYCSIYETEDYLVFDLGGGNYDTVYVSGGGYGGGISDAEFKFKKNKLQKPEIMSLDELYSSICLETRRRNYSTAHDLCEEMLTNYPDSVQSLDAAMKLYLASLVLDSNGNKMSNLKTFFESLILENGENEYLVKKLFYLIQKSKVALHQYQSALTGFQEIINENPYNYDGLLASWDYAATYLLDSSNGSGGGAKNYELVTDLKDDPKDKFDSKVFTKEDRKLIRTNVIQSFETAKEKEINIVKELEKKISEGTANENEKTELQKKKVLNEMIKIKEPKDITEHILIINNNIEKLFGANTKIESDESRIEIPNEFSLSQNYPNPFNPTTKITFDLPEDGTVKLFIYDMLGREILKLVNNELKTAGRYTVEFNGANLASGVYFYRLEVNKFVQTKRMVLIK